MADMDITMTETLGRLIMSPQVLSMVAGALATTWRRIAVVSIVKPVKVAAPLHELTEPRLLRARCRLFRRGRVPAGRILVGRDHIEVCPTRILSLCPGSS